MPPGQAPVHVSGNIQVNEDTPGVGCNVGLARGSRSIRAPDLSAAVAVMPGTGLPSMLRDHQASVEGAGARHHHIG